MTDEPRQWTLRTPRLRLRPLNLGDAGAMSELLHNDRDAVFTTTRVPFPCTEDAARTWIAGCLTPDEYMSAVMVSGTDEFIGCAGIILDESALATVLGYWIGRPFWGQGFATEAASAVLEFARRKGSRAVEARTYAGNPASVRVLEKIGFTPTGSVGRDRSERGKDREVYKFVLTLAP